MMRARGKHPVLLLAAVALAVLASALADPACAQQAAAGSSYGGPLLDRATLTGDWGGARDALAAQGITITPGLTQFYQGPTAGNTNHVFDYGGKAEAFINIDGGKLGLWDGFGITVHGEYNYGRTPVAVGGTTIPNNTAMTFPYANQSGGDLSSVFVSQQFGQSFTLLAGKMNMFDFYALGRKFNGGRGIESFWNTAFVGPPSGMVPVAAFGAVGSYRADPLTFTGMVYDPDDALNRTGFEHPFKNGVTFRASVDLSSSPFGLPRTDSIAAAITNEHGTDFSTLPYLTLGSNSPEFRRAFVKALIARVLFGQPIELPYVSNKMGGQWFGYSFEQTLWQSAANPAKSWGLFGQAAMSDGNPNRLKWSVLGGIGGSGLFPGRLDDKFGVGAFYYANSDELIQHLQPLVQLGAEYGAEIFYNFAITKSVKLTTDAQVLAPAIKGQVATLPIVNPTVVNNPTVVLLGLRLQVAF